MITEDYVSYEVAKLLKEKGFDIPTMFVWYEHTPYITSKKVNNKPSMDFIYLTDSPEDERFIRFSNNDKVPEYISGNVYSCPTHQMAMKWLREVHNIDIDIEASVGMLGIKVYVPFISTYKPLKDVPLKVHQIKRGIYYKDDQGVIPSLQHFDSYEEAAEVVLKYVLKNLI